MVDRKQIIAEIILEAVQAEPKKLQLSAKLKKLALEDEDATDLTIHANFKMETAYLGETLTEEAFFIRCWIKCYRICSVLIATEMVGCSKSLMAFTLN